MSRPDPFPPNGGIGIGVLEQEGMVTDYDDVLVQPMTGQ